MRTVWRDPLPWPAPALIALVAVGPCEGQDEAWHRHLVGQPGDAGASVIHFYLAACDDGPGTGP